VYSHPGSGTTRSSAQPTRITDGLMSQCVEMLM
jgi:hypothetical protein